MKKHTFLFAFLLLPFLGFSWGYNGHRMVAQVAQENLNAKAAQNVQHYLGKDSLATIASWLDEVRGNNRFKAGWHFVNMNIDKPYVKAPGGDVVSVLDSIIKELRNYKNLPDSTVIIDIKILTHLCGDIAQPLHVGFGFDKGGNDLIVRNDKSLPRGDSLKLHGVWDSGIIKQQAITLASCDQIASQWTAKELKKIKTDLKPMNWLIDSRKQIPNVYNFQYCTLTSAYYASSATIIKQQIEKGGLRLAGILNDIFGK